MRQIILDTETTGLEVRQGHRLIEVAGVEMVNRRLTGRHLHRYVHPERDIDAGAMAVHGITLDFLADKPKFKEIAHELADFLAGAELIIHNAPFDVGFLNHEFSLVGLPPVTKIAGGILDTLRMAKDLHPGKRNNLDALCERYGVDNSNRTLHGALLDAEILADVYLSMTRGQESLVMELDSPPPEQEDTVIEIQQGPRPPLRVISASDDENQAHATVLAAIDKESKGKCLWLPHPAPEAS
ncbi:DNA polymerase III subunit epsilon [Oryzomicrobium terrae]|uniref:DNA polymerase III subunit epsilon n=1 Tax=Oryzomicrobium terrae TaxID=1735038 RepID=A0A5C1E7V6_9RHOO|nr:DNA polymerase III subunit epsilon [Oryzomicrobium terrae]QEL64679.1 DNA polymerase III subunit epsilon [Oryzomicrobium terrae]